MLDKSRAFGEVSGALEGYPGARYMQDGKIFDGAGREIAAPSKPVKSEVMSPDSAFLRLLDNPVHTIVKAMDELGVSGLEALINVETKGLKRPGVLNPARRMRRRLIEQVQSRS